MTINYEARPLLADLRPDKENLHALFQRANVSSFTGREWLVREIDNFLANEDSGYFLIEAEAGLGKTAFAAWFTAHRKYPCHFTGTSVKARQTADAVGSLVAQLIENWHLDDLAPDGRIPQWATDSQGLDRVLQKAAQRRDQEQPGTPIVLIVDGLDEFDPNEAELRAPISLPLGLPTDLPQGVYVIATFRSGASLPGLRRPYTMCNWRYRQEANLADMRLHLQKTSREPWLAAKLSDADIDQDTLVETLLERCAGVWIYLHYVLAEIEKGRRQLSELSRLPDNLTAYYTDNLATLRNSDGWYEEHLPVLATLTAVFEPLDHMSLTLMAGVADARPVRAFLATRIRPFLSITGELETFSFYHDSLRAFIDYRGNLPGDTPEFMTELRQELKEAVRQAHQRICDYYLTAWGNIANGLSNLAENPYNARVHGEYGIRNLARHLIAAGREDDLHDLLACEHLGRNTWYFVHDRIGDLGGYLDDVAHGRRLAATETDVPHTGRRSRSSIALEIRYRLIEASIISLASNIPGQLVRVLVDSDRWSPDHALTFLRNVASSDNSPGGLALIASYLPPDRLNEEASQALSHPTAGLLLSLAPHLSPSMLPRALEAVSEISDSLDRGRVLRAMAEYLPQDCWPRAVQLAREISNKWEQVMTLALMSDHFEGHQRVEAINVALEVAESRPRDWFGTIALAAVAARLPDEARPRVLRLMLDIAEKAEKEEDRAGILGVLARDIANRGAPQPLIIQIVNAALMIPRTMPESRADALGALVPRMPAEQQSRILAEALTAARAIDDWRQRADRLAGLVPHVSAEQQHSLISEAIGAAREGPDDSSIKEIARLAELHLSGSDLARELADALESCASLDNEFKRASALKDMIPTLPVELLNIALAIARGITYGKNRAELLAMLAQRLPMAMPELIEEALAAARAISDGIRQVEALAALLPYIPSDMRAHAQNAILAKARDLDDGQRGPALITLARQAARQDRQVIVAEAVSASSALTVFTALPHAAENFFAAALKEATETKDIWKRLDLITNLAKVCPDDYIDVTLKAIRKLGESFIPTFNYMAIPGLPERFTVSQTVSGLQAKALAALVPRLPDSLATIVLDEAINAAKFLADRLGPSSSVVVHEYVAQQVALQAMRWRSQSDVQKLWMAAHQVTGRRLLADALFELLPCLKEEHRNQVVHNALNLYRSIPLEWDVFSRIPGADGVSRIMPYLGDRERASLVTHLLESTRLQNRSWERAHAIENLAPHLSPAQLLEALKILHDIPDEAARCHGMETLGSIWADDPSPLLQEVSAVTSPWRKHSVLRRLLRRFEELDQPENPLFSQPLFRQWPSGLGRDGVLNLIGDISWWLHRYGGQGTVNEIVEAIGDVTRWWP